MAHLSNSEYGRRKSDLVHAIGLAESEWRNCSYKEITASGTTEQTAAAKGHLDQLRANLETLEIAWVAAGAEEVRQKRAARVKAFKAYAAEVEGLLGARQESVASIIEAATTLAEQIAAYGDASQRIRRLSLSFAGGNRAIETLDFAVDPSVWTASQAASATLADAGVSLTPGQRSSDCFGELRTAEAFEDRIAQRIRAAVAQLEPKEA